MTNDSQETRERKRRRKESFLALAAIVFIAFLTWMEIKYLGAESYLFLVFFNLNLVLLLVILFVVSRNAVKLLLERRRKLLGSKLRTRLVLAFVSLSIVPTLLMSVVTMKLVHTSFDYWFNLQVENTMEQALDVGREFYQLAKGAMERIGKTVINGVRDKRLAWNGKQAHHFLEEKYREYELGFLFVLSPEHQIVYALADENWKRFWDESRETINLNEVLQQRKSLVSIIQGRELDAVVGVFVIDKGEAGLLVIGKGVGNKLAEGLDQIVRGVEEYKKSNISNYPLKLTLYIISGVMSLLIILSAMWFGFRLAKEISAPVQALAAGTERIAKGDFTVRLEDQSEDELGLLVKSFNRMAEDMEKARESLTQAYSGLERQTIELERRGQYIEAILKNVTAGVISMDETGLIQTVNKAAENILGFEAETIIGKTPETILKGEYAHLAADATALLKSSPATKLQRQLDLNIAGRELKLLVNMVAIGGAEGEKGGIIAVIEDVTELEKMQRMAAWREVARRIAHEIKNPLTPIKLSAQRLEKKFSSLVYDPVFSQCTSLIVRQVEHLQHMVTEFSAFAKLPEVELRTDYLAPLLEEVVSLFKNSHSRIKWVLDFGSEIPPFKFDHEAMRRALINILTNAAEALEGREDGAVAITAAHDKLISSIRLEIGDNGPGLTPEETSKLFEPYFSRKKGGTGLGLSIVKSIVSDHHGYIRARSNIPGGTVITMEFPIRA